MSVQSIQCLVLDVRTVTVNCSAIDFGALLEEMEILRELPFSVQKAFY